LTDNPFNIDGQGKKVDGYIDMLGAVNTRNDDWINGYEKNIGARLTGSQTLRRTSIIDTDDNAVDFESIDFRTRNTSLTNIQRAVKRPKNLTFGVWDPFDENAGITDPDGEMIITFSHLTGLYPSSFNLTLTANTGAVIYYSIDGSIPLPSNVDGERVFQYTSPITVLNRNGQPNLLATPENVAMMFGHTNDPRGHMPHPYFPTNAQVPKATVIRAIAVDSQGRQSEVVTRTFFIGNNLANYADHPVISIVTDPFNLLDETYGIYVRGADTNRWNASESPTGTEYNFRLGGREREREVVFEFFDEQRNAAISSGAGIRVRGGWSRALGQKSFNVYFRSEYGMSDLNYYLIPGALQADGRTPTTRFRDFILRSGGNDAETTKFRDVYIQSLFKDRNFAIQTGRPSVVYLNGEYWGVYNIQERYSDRYVEYKNYAASRNNVVIFTALELDEGIESDWDLFREYTNFQNMDFSIQANYEAFCNIVDIQSYIDYFAAQLYIHNQDWPNNNFRMWRVRVPEPAAQEPASSHYGDGKWRFMMYDTEFSMGIYANGAVAADGVNAFQRLNGKGHNANIFLRLMNNVEFARRFVTTMMDLYNVNFDYNSNIVKLNEIAGLYRPLMEDHYRRFGPSWISLWNFDNDVQNIRNYLFNIRSAMTENYLPTNFSNTGISAANLVNVTLSTNTPNASIRINTTTPTLTGGSWTGKYYSALPITVTANIPNGYVFTGWTVSGNGTAATPGELTTTVTFTGNVQITANYGVP
jgi:hypothetical protein